MSTIDISVEGMTCQHCVNAVTEELHAIESVESVDIDLVVGGKSTVHIATSKDVPSDQIAAAIDEAGYAIAA